MSYHGFMRAMKLLTFTTAVFALSVGAHALAAFGMALAVFIALHQDDST